MEIDLIIGENLSTDLYEVQNNMIKNKQVVDFCYVLNEISADITDVKKYDYTGTESLISKYPETGLILLNYDQTSPRLENASDRKFGISTVPTEEYLGGVSIYRKEIWYTLNSETNTLEAHEEPTYHVVVDETSSGIVTDYNIGNNRYYKYLYRFVYTDGSDNIYSRMGLQEVVAPIQVKWNGWTLSDLHEVEYSDGTKYTTTLADTWKFKFNITPGQQTQNLARTQQDTLGVYPRFSQGLKNTISGSVTCYLGKDLTPAVYSSTHYVYEKTLDSNKNIKDWSWKPQQGIVNKNLGGYKEALYDSVYYANATSNSGLDMLNAWRGFCYSGNPKLLRDAKGQRFIVQLSDTTNTTQESWNRRPEEISFTWTQIADADDVSIIEEV